jgi:hypothetical protein
VPFVKYEPSSQKLERCKSGRWAGDNNPGFFGFF